MNNTVTPIKIFSQQDYNDISRKNLDFSRTVESSLKIEALKWTTNQDIAELIYHLNVLSDKKWYWELSILSVTEDVKSTIILITWITEENLQEIMW